MAQTQAQLDAWRATPLDDLELVALLIDGVHVGGHCIVVALGLDKPGAGVVGLLSPPHAAVATMRTAQVAKRRM